MNCEMPCRIRKLNKPAIYETTRKYRQQNKQKQIFMSKFQNLFLKALSSKIKISVDKTLATKTHLTSTTSRLDISLMGLNNQSTIKRKMR